MATAAKWMEEYWTKVIGVITLGAIVWVGASLNKLVIAVPLIEERVMVLQLQSRDLQDKISNLPSTMTRTEVDERVRPIERDLDDLKVQVRRIEKDLYVTYPNPSKRVGE